MTFSSDIDRDVLIARVVDGEASARDWETLKDLASRDQTVWAELSETQRAHDELVRAVERATAPAACVELPEVDVPVVNVTQRRLDAVSKFGGWAAAAAIVLVGYVGLRMPQFQQAPDETMTGSMIPVATTPEEAANRYLALQDDSGAFLRELPEQVILGYEPGESGRTRVYKVRQLVVVDEVDEVLQRAKDEFGNTVEVPVRVARPGSAF